MVVILLTCWRLLHDRIISLRRALWVQKNSWTPPLFIKMPVPSQEIERSCISVLGLSILTLPTILIFDFGIVPMVWYFLFFILWPYSIYISVIYSRDFHIKKRLKHDNVFVAVCNFLLDIYIPWRLFKYIFVTRC